MPIAMKVLGGLGNATDPDVREGVTYTSDEGIKRTGTMQAGGTGTDYVLPQATETKLGGIKAKAKTNETVEIAIDGATGKLYAPTYPTGGSSDYPSYDEETQTIFITWNCQPTYDEETQTISLVGW